MRFIGHRSYAALLILAIVLLVSPIGLAQTATVTLHGTPYTLVAHPRVLLDGPSGPLTLSLADTSSTGKQNTNDVLWQALLTDNTNWLTLNQSVAPAWSLKGCQDCYAYDGSNNAPYADFRGPNAGIVGVLTNDQTKINAGIWGVDHVEELISGTFGCDEGGSQCGRSGGYEAEGATLAVTPVLQAYSLLRSKMSDADRKMFANKLLNDLWQSNDGGTAVRNGITVAGEVYSVTVTNGGSGYGVAPTVSFAGGGCTREPAGTAYLTAGAVDWIILSDGGAGCSSAPTVTFSGGTAAATANLVPANASCSIVKDDHSTDCGCQNQGMRLVTTATITTSASSTDVVAATGDLTTYPNLAAGSVLFSSSGTFLGMVQSVDSATHITLTLNAHATNASAITFRYSAPWTSTSCGLVWFSQHHSLGFSLVPNQSTSTTTMDRDYPTTTTHSYATYENKRLSKLHGFILIGLALADDDLRAVRLLENAYNYTYDLYGGTAQSITPMSTYSASLSWHADGFNQAGAGYSDGRWEYTWAETLAALRNSGGPDLITNNEPVAGTRWYWNYVWQPGHPAMQMAWAETAAPYTGNIQRIIRAPLIATYLAGSSDVATQRAYDYIVNQLGSSYFSAAAYSAGLGAAYSMQSFLFYDPAVTVSPLSSAPMQHIFRTTAYSLHGCPTGLTCYANQTDQYMYSRSDWTSTASSLFVSAAYCNSALGDHCSEDSTTLGVQQAGSYAIINGSAPVFGGSGSIASDSGYAHGMYRSSMVQIGGPAISNTTNWAFRTFSELTRSPAITRWAGGTNDGGVANNQYAYMQLDLTSQYLSGITGYFRDYLQLKPTSGNSYVLIHDSVNNSTPQPIWAYGFQNGWPLASSKPSATITVNTGALTVGLSKTTGEKLFTGYFPDNGTTLSMLDEGYLYPGNSTASTLVSTNTRTLDCVADKSKTIGFIYNGTVTVTVPAASGCVNVTIYLALSQLTTANLTGAVTATESPFQTVKLVSNGTAWTVTLQATKEYYYRTTVCPSGCGVNVASANWTTVQWPTLTGSGLPTVNVIAPTLEGTTGAVLEIRDAANPWNVLFCNGGGNVTNSAVWSPTVSATSTKFLLTCLDPTKSFNVTVNGVDPHTCVDGASACTNLSVGAGDDTLYFTAVPTGAVNITATGVNNGIENLTIVGSGTVTSSPAGLSCGASCAVGFADGTNLVLTAVPATGYTFTGWTASDHGCTGTGTCVHNPVAGGTTYNDTATFAARTLSSIAVTPSSPTITLPGTTTQQFTATCSYSSGLPDDCTASVTWGSSNTSVATIDAAGLATAVSNGTSTITATQGAISSPGDTLTVSYSKPLAGAGAH